MNIYLELSALPGLLPESSHDKQSERSVLKNEHDSYIKIEENISPQGESPDS
jgi:hypothetical protein